MIWICKDDKVCNCLPLITDLNFSLSFRKLTLSTTWMSRKRAVHFSEQSWKKKYIYGKKSFIVSTCNTKHIENKSYTALEKKIQLQVISNASTHDDEMNFWLLKSMAYQRHVSSWFSVSPRQTNSGIWIGKQVAQRATIAHLSPMCQGQISFKKHIKNI